MARLTSRQRQAVIARYLAGESIASLAKEYNISYQALAKQVKQEKVIESLKKVENEQAMTMAAFIQSKKEQTQDIIEALLDKLQDKIDKASFKDCIAGIKDLASLYLEREDNSIDNTVKVVIERKVQDLTDETDNE
nr:MAG TPA: ECF sigma factor [Caudoviricetes sp.]